VEILASHQKSAGRHMAGDPSMVAFNKLFALARGENILALRIRILQNLLAEMKRWCQDSGVRVVDYRQLTEKAILDVMDFFSLQPTSLECETITRRLGFNSKELDQSFSSDSRHKQLAFNAQEREQIDEATMSLYESLKELILS
jgi:hypothetical protein